MTSFSDLTTMRVGGPLGHYQSFSSTRTLISGAKKIWAETDEWMALGSGSNLVVSDAGFDGHVLHIKTRGITVKKATGQRVKSMRKQVKTGMILSLTRFPKVFGGWRP